LPAPVSSGEDDRVTVNRFERKNIDVCIELGDTWTEGLEKSVKEHVERTVKQRLRLAVGTEHLSDHTLAWEVRPKGDHERGVRMRLAEGRIEGP